jgi:hypothetical protein
VTPAEQNDFKYRLGVLYLVIVGAFLYAIVESNGAAAFLGFIAFVIVLEVRAERKVAMQTVKDSKEVVSFAHSVVDILQAVKDGRIDPATGAEQIQQLKDDLKNT